MSIVARIRAHGGDVIRDEWRVSIRRGRLTEAALAWIRSNRAALMAEVWPQHDAWEERAAIMEFDAGLPRDVAEAMAWRGVASC